MIDRFEELLELRDHEFPSGFFGFDLENDFKDSNFPVLLITGWVLSLDVKNKRFRKSGGFENSKFDFKACSSCAKYWVLFDQKNGDQVGFQVKLGQPNFEFGSRTVSSSSSPNILGKYSGFKRRLRGRFRRRRLGFYWSLNKPRKIVMVSSSEEEMEEIKAKEPIEFNRVCFTYSSEGNERFYGFGEQFSHMNFKGKRVPIFVQEQGIGRGDQPITFAANLVSYRLDIKPFFKRNKRNRKQKIKVLSSEV